MHRLRLPDLLKGIAIVLMIQVHIMELFMDHSVQQSVVGKVSLFLGGPFTAIIFMIVMGYFVAASKKTLWQTIKRGVELFFLGFLLNVGLNLNLLLRINFQGWQYNPLEYIFGVDILYLAGLSIIFLACLKSVPTKFQKLVPFVLLLLVLILTNKVNALLTTTERKYISPFIGGYWSWSYFPIFPWLAYPLAGYFFFTIEGSITHWINHHRKYTVFIVLLLAATVFYYSKTGFNTTINLSSYYHHTISYGFWALGVLVLWTSFFYLITKTLRITAFERVLAWMGRNITVIYVVQWLVIGNIATAIYQTQALKLFPVWFLGVLFVSLVLSWQYKKIKASFS